MGSGFIISSDGLILTNAHVVGGAKEVTVKLTDKREFKAKVIGADKRTDVALIKIEGSGLPVVKFGDPNKLKVGEWVVAIGSPFGFENTVTAGIVSAKGRSLPQENFVPFIQTDVAINPGNSGGPLLNTHGQVVGLNTLVLPYAQGIGFAVSATTAAWVASLLIQRGQVDRRFLGIAATAITLPPEQARDTGQPRAVRVLKVGEGTPAANAGLEAEDLLLGIDERPVTNVDDVQRLLALATAPEVSLNVLRKGRRRTLRARATPREHSKAA
jgi:S1-C subfamily serine protease